MTAPATDAGLSRWWPTPARPTDHFSAEELRRSSDVHRPLQRLRLGLAAAQISLLVGLAWLLGGDGLGGAFGGAEPWLGSLVGAGAVLLAVRPPEWVAAWRLTRLVAVEPVGGGAGGLAAVVVGLVVPLVVLTVAARFALDALVDPSTGWPLVLAVALATVVGTSVMTGLRARGAEAIDRPERWAGLAGRAGVADVRFGLLADGVGGGGPNACAMAAGWRRWVLVDPSLMSRQDVSPGPSLADFVVAHEVTHLAKRHPELQLGLYAVTVLVALGSLPALGPGGWPWSSLGAEPGDPRTLPVAVVLVMAAATASRLPITWVLRGLERVADSGAVELVGVPDRDAVRAFYLVGGGDLALPRWSMMFAARPSPVERLEFLDRRRPVRRWPPSRPRPAPGHPSRPVADR